MSLIPGTKLAHYEVVESIGAGGMGEVYRARDTKLGREVAIKVLPEEFAKDEGRLTRFEREARLLAQLNHANIATLYGLEEHDGQQFLVMELVEGETLAERIAQGPIPVDEAIPLFVQIAEGLEAAHEKGIIHRDLKPANIKIGPEGKPKILDFGLAKAFAGGETAPDSSQSPTLTKGTALGAIMGTAAYMSPEQARGNPVDKRTDIWAFGVCFYEALTGRRLFRGDDSAQILAGVLKDDPDWGSIPRECPEALHWVLHRCLARDRAERLHDIADAGIELKLARSGSWRATAVRELASDRAWHRGWRGAALAASPFAAGVLVMWLWQGYSTPGAARITNHFELSVGQGSRMLRGVGRPLALTSDGRRVVYTALHNNRNQLFLRSLDSFATVAIAGGDDAIFPFLSPDDEWVAFFANGELWKIPLEGGSPISLARAPFPWGGSWGSDGQIVFSPMYNSGLWRVPANGGMAEQLTAPDFAEKGYGHVWPQHLPDGQTIAFTVWTGDPAEGGLAVLSLETGAWRVVHPGVLGGYYSQSGHLLYYPSGSPRAVLASTFDASSMSVGSFSAAVLGDAQVAPFAATFSLALSSAGTLAYLAEPSDTPAFQSVHRDGVVTPVEMELPSVPLWPRLSPDGKMAVAVGESAGRQRRDGQAGSLWLFDLERGTSTPLLGDFLQGAVAGWPIWSSDGTTISFGSNRAGSWDIYA
ncbi:MAG TPA: protein kinase, partial [Vicinamibacteria bacterium]|nr:protein kinase [Vicinamibacteria bacterium]